MQAHAMHWLHDTGFINALNVRMHVRVSPAARSFAADPGPSLLGLSRELAHREPARFADTFSSKFEAQFKRFAMCDLTSSVPRCRAFWRECGNELESNAHTLTHLPARLRTHSCLFEIAPTLSSTQKASAYAPECA